MTINKIWYPFSQEGIISDKIKIIRGKNEYLYDENGKYYIDLISSWWTSIHGHCNPVLTKAIKGQIVKLDHVIFSDFTHENAEKLIHNLDKSTFGVFGKFFFSDNGSTAVEVAIKIAHQYWKNIDINNKNIVISFENGYHGDTLGAMSVGRRSGYFNQFTDLMPEFKFLKYPSTWIGDMDIIAKEDLVLQEFNNLIKEFNGRISSLIIEPLIQGAGGMNMCRIVFLENLVRICNENKIIVIFDEVMTGFYRTGKMFAFQNTSISPDIMCLSKGITGGILPLGVTCIASWVYQVFFSKDINKSFLHGHSYTANPITCAVANASFDLIINEKTTTKIVEINSVYTNMLKQLQDSQFIEKVRYIGTILAFDIKINNMRYGSVISQKLKNAMIDEGLNLRPLGKTLYFMPPYCISSQKLKKYINKAIKIIGNFAFCIFIHF